MSTWLFDPAVKGFPFDSDGNAKLAHPVDQAVALAVGVPLGTIAWAPSTGIDLQAIRRAPPNALATTITYEVRRALATLIAAEDITFISAPLRRDANERPFFDVNYVNRRRPQTSSPQVTTQSFPAPTA